MFLQNLEDLLNSKNRLDWNEYFSALSLLIASRSPSSKLKVGSVIVRDNRVISSGYNGFPAGVEHLSIHRDGHEINTIHAEQNAISDSARRGASIERSTIYITHFPCINCAKYIISSGIKKVIYLHDYRNDDVVKELFQQCNVQMEKIKL